MERNWFRAGKSKRDEITSAGIGKETGKRHAVTFPIVGFHGYSFLTLILLLFSCSVDIGSISDFSDIHEDSIFMVGVR
jgi:hypothetical protein